MYIKKFLIVILGLAYLLAGVLMPKFSTSNSEVFAEQNEEVFTILGKDFDYPNKTSFTPFNFATNARMPGFAGGFEADEFGRFDQSFNFNEVEALSVNKNWELGLWFYFSTKNLHDLTITLSKDEKSITFFIDSQSLDSLLTKQTEFGLLDQEDDGYSWNYLELPFSVGAQNQAVNGEQFVAFDTISIKFTSNEPDANLDYAKIYVYQAIISPTDLELITIRENNKQAYRLFDINFYSKEILDSVFVDDELTLSGRQELIKFA